MMVITGMCLIEENAYRKCIPGVQPIVNWPIEEEKYA